MPGRPPATHAALLAAGERDAVALTGAWAGVAAVVASAPLELLDPGDDPFAALDRLPMLMPGSDPGVAVGGGWLGALGYALAGTVERTVPPPPRSLRLPSAPLAFHDHVLICDHKGSWWFEALWTPERADALRARRDELAARVAAAPRPRAVRLRDAVVRAPGAAGHQAAVVACRERIAAGEVFQVNVCLHVDARLEGRPADLAVAAAERLAPAHGALVQGGWGALVSASPELFLRRTGRGVRTAPIKGTAPADGAEALASSPKDRAENVMIVDLMRNDLGRVCTFGSVAVEALARVVPGAGVAHLVSEVSGTLRPEVDDADLLRATFPPGSVTGAPKVQALRVIAELEGSARELYTGAIGYASPVAGLELSVAIRTFESDGARIQLGVGGGITAASDPAAELEECRIKARPLLALGGADVPGGPRAPGRGTSGRAPGDRVVPLALAAGRERPRPGRGVFETLAVRDGTSARLEAHLVRLRASAGALGFPVPADLTSQVAAAGALAGAGRLRVDLRPDGALVTAAGPLPPPGPPVVLVPWVLPGGLGAHKWADRGLLDALATAGGGVPLLVDGDGSVLEAAWASVWAQEGGRLLTPPADGRLLPGITRATLLAEDPRCAVEAISLARLEAAERVWVSSALRGLAPAVVLKGGLKIASTQA